jgi:hypothetical protein
MVKQQQAVGQWSIGRVTAMQGTLLLVGLALTAYAVAAFAVPGAARAQGPGGFVGGGPGMGQEAKIVTQFDRNKDDRLDAEERKAAREWLAANPTGRRGFGRRGGGFRGSMNEGTPGRTIAVGDVRAYGAEPLYDSKTLRTIFLRFENPDWEQELAAFNNTDVEVPATVVVDGKTYKDVGVHFRGASSFMMVPEGSKRSLNLAFDFVDKRQTLGGYRTLNLLNANGDPTFMRAVLYARIANAYIPAPKTNFVRVVINGESWGIYANAQQFNRDFLRDFFNTERGARWKVPGSPGGGGGMDYRGDDPAAYKRTYEIKTKDDPKAWADLIRMFKILNETVPDKLEAALAPVLDVDGVLKFLALDVALVNSDGYWIRASDYSIYQDPKGRFHVIPHDMNEALAAEGPGRRMGPPPGFRPGEPPPGFGPGGPPPDARTGGPDAPVRLPFPPPGGGRGFAGFRGGGPDLDPLIGLDDASKPLRSRLLAVPALRARYLAYVRDIAERWLDWKALEPIVEEYQSLIAKDVKDDTRKLYSFEAFESGLTAGAGSLKSFVDTRRAFLIKVTDPKPQME